MNNRIEKMNFKKIFIIYIICFLVVVIGLCTFLGIIYKDKLAFLYDYHRVSEQFEESSYNQNLQNKLSNMANNSNDIIDIIILDKNNKIKSSFKNSQFAKQDTFLLERLDSTETRYFVSQNNEGVVFKLVKDKELILTTIFTDIDNKILNDYKDDVFFEPVFNEKDIYLLSYTANEITGEKIYFISEIHPVTNGEMYLEFSLSVVVFFFMIYWVLVAFAVYQNALKLKLNPYLWGGITLITNIAGVILYLIYKQTGITCKKCNTFQDKNNVYCTNCGTKINEVCDECNHIVRKEDKYCANCRRKL